MNNQVLYRHLFALILLAAFFAQAFSSSFIIAGYYSNTKAFAKKCVNKAHPQMHCNGKCQMMKRLSQEEKKDQQVPERKESKNDILFFIKLSYTIADFSILNEPNNFALFNTGKIVSMPRSLFHPPGC